MVHALDRTLTAKKATTHPNHPSDARRHFAAQALGFVLSMAVLGIVLGWLRVDQPPAPVRALRRLAHRWALRHQEPEAWPSSSAPTGKLRSCALVAIFAVFGVLVFTHQLSPYLLLFGVGLLTGAGKVRPRLVIVGLGVITVAYLVPRVPFLESGYHIFDSWQVFYRNGDATIFQLLPPEVAAGKVRTAEV